MDKDKVLNALGWIQEELSNINHAVTPPTRRKVAYRVVKHKYFVWDPNFHLPIPDLKESDTDWERHQKRLTAQRKRDHLVTGLKPLKETGEGYVLGRFCTYELDGSDLIQNEEVLIERLDGSIVSTTWDEIQFLT